MQDEAYRKEILLPFHALDENAHPELLIASTFEKIGTYARHGLLDTVLITEHLWGPSFARCGSSSRSAALLSCADATIRTHSRTSSFSTTKRWIGTITTIHRSARAGVSGASVVSTLALRGLLARQRGDSRNRADGGDRNEVRDQREAVVERHEPIEAPPVVLPISRCIIAPASIAPMVKSPTNVQVTRGGRACGRLRSAGEINRSP